MLVIFVLIFTPLPMRIIVGELPPSDLGQAANCLGMPALVLGAIAWFVWKVRARGSTRLHPKLPPQ
jgi:hypothetical protein